MNVDSNFTNNKKIAIVVSSFNEFVTDKLLDGAQRRLLELGIADAHIHITKVPGAVEIPLATKLLAMQERYHAIICLGAVIRGETGHYDYVCQQVSSGCQQVMMQFNVPVIFGVITTENRQQAMDRVGGKAGHKGREAADAAYQMMSVVQALAV